MRKVRLDTDTGVQLGRVRCNIKDNSSQYKNIFCIFADQWRGTPDTNQCHTPNLDKLKLQGVDFVNAISSCSQCSPCQGSLLSGLYPLSHGVFVNDSTLSPKYGQIALNRP